MEPEKKIVDQVPGWLTVFDDGSVDRTWTGPPEVKFMSDPVPPHGHFIDGVATIDMAIDRLKLRIYLPQRQENDTEKLPVLLHFHGGGFCVSQPDWFMYYALYTALARIVRAVVVSVYLRRAPEHRLPAPCDDGFSALLLLRSIAAGKHPDVDFDADFNRVFLIGESSGGNIVHQVALRAGRENLAPLRIAGAISIHPGFCRSRRSKSEVEQPETPFLTVEMIDKFLGLALPVGATKDHPITCPMGGDAEAVEEELPPYLYCVAEQDLLHDPQMEFYEAMKRGKRQVDLILSEGVGHCFHLNKMAVETDRKTADETKKLLEGMKCFVGKH